MSRYGLAALPRGATGLSAVCDCGITWSYSLTIFEDNVDYVFAWISYMETIKNIKFEYRIPCFSYIPFSSIMRCHDIALIVLRALNIDSVINLKHLSYLHKNWKVTLPVTINCISVSLINISHIKWKHTLILYLKKSCCLENGVCDQGTAHHKGERQTWTTY